MESKVKLKFTHKDFSNFQISFLPSFLLDEQPTTLYFVSHFDLRRKIDNHGTRTVSIPSISSQSPSATPTRIELLHIRVLPFYEIQFNLNLNLHQIQMLRRRSYSEEITCNNLQILQEPGLAQHFARILVDQNANLSSLTERSTKSA
jgi:hypothetical protein